MPIFVEHESIKSGLQQVMPFEAFQQMTMLCIGWSHRDKLSLRPEWSILSHMDVEYIRLPVPLVDLQNAIDHAISDGEARRYHELQYPLFQLQQSLLLLEQDVLLSHDNDRAYRRLSEIKRFCHMNWPAAPLKLILERIDFAFDRKNNDEIIPLCRAARDTLLILPLSAFEVIITGKDKDHPRMIDSFDAIETLSSNFPLYQSELIPTVLFVLRDRWWNMLEDDLTVYRSRFEQWGVSLFAPSIMETVNRLVEATRQVAEILDDLSTPACIEKTLAARGDDLRLGLVKMRQELHSMHASYSAMKYSLPTLMKGCD